MLHTHFPRLPAGSVPWEPGGGEFHPRSPLFCCFGRSRNDVDVLTRAFLFEGHNTIDFREERMIDAHPDVRSSAVIGLPDEEWGASVHAIVQPVDGTVLDEASLLAFLRDRLAGYKQPRSVEFTDEPMRDEAGKVRRAALRAARLSTADSAAR